MRSFELGSCRGRITNLFPSLLPNVLPLTCGGRQSQGRSGGKTKEKGADQAPRGNPPGRRDPSEAVDRFNGWLGTPSDQAIAQRELPRGCASRVQPSAKEATASTGWNKCAGGETTRGAQQQEESASERGAPPQPVASTREVSSSKPGGCSRCLELISHEAATCSAGPLKRHHETRSRQPLG